MLAAVRLLRQFRLLLLINRATAMTTSKPVKHLTIKTIGKERYSTKPNSMELYGGIFFGLLLFPGGCALFGWGIYQLFFSSDLIGADEREFSRVAAAIVIGLLMLAASIYLCFNVRRVLAYQVTICWDGFYVIDRGKTTVFAWEDVALIHEAIVHVTVKFTRWQPKSMAEQRIERSYTVHRADGETFTINDKLIRHAWRIIDPICAASKQHNIPWKTSHSKMTL